MLLEKIDDFIAYLKYKTIRTKYYRLAGERKYFEDNFSKVNPDDYELLIKNLDEKSIRTVNNIIERIKLIVTNQDAEKFDFWDLDEKIVLNRIKHHYWSSIKNLPNGSYSYKNYILPIKHFEVNVIYNDCNIKEFSDLSDLKNRSIIDVGGFIGDSAVVLRKYSDAPLYVFEPDDENFGYLQKTIELNNLKDVITEKIALGDKEATVSMSGVSCCAKINDTDGDIKQTTLDAYVEEHNINVGLIKADVEGYEKQLILGAKNTILKQKPKLLISMYHNYEQFFGLKPMIEDFGYRCKVVKPTDGAVLLETVLVAEPV